MYNLITTVQPEPYEVGSPLTSAPSSDNGMPYVLYSNGSTSSFEYMDPLAPPHHMPENHQFVVSIPVGTDIQKAFDADYDQDYAAMPQPMDNWHCSSFSSVSSTDSTVYPPEPAVAPEGFEHKIQNDYKELFNCVERVTINNSGQGNSLLVSPCTPIEGDIGS